MNTDLNYFKPRMIISRCFLKPVRYDGEMIKSSFVEKIKDYVEFVDVCPECDIGLGVPRERVILVKRNNSKRLIQPETNIDLTEKIQSYLKITLYKIKNIDGILLKAKSPSCGVSTTKLHDKNGNVIGKTDGMLAEAIKKNFPYLPVEDEERLKDFEIRYHFLTRLFAFADLRCLGSNSISDLIDFHLSYKYLLMTYNQKLLRELGRLVADNQVEIREKVKRYKLLFYSAFEKKPSITKHYNTLLHIMGYLTKDLSKIEKKYLIGLMEKYRKGLIELKVMLELFRDVVVKFNVHYLLKQKYMLPFPEELNSIEC